MCGTLLILVVVCFQESQITIECIIPQNYHRTVMGAKGTKVQEITREFDVGIKFPDRPSEAECTLLNRNQFQRIDMIVHAVPLSNVRV